MKWHAQMENDSVLTRAKIAHKEGISRARVTQVMALLDLPQEIQNHLSKLTDPLEIRFLNERRLRQIVSLKSDALRLEEWAEMLRRFKENVVI